MIFDLRDSQIDREQPALLGSVDYLAQLVKWAVWAIEVPDLL